jgi:hypothetical protein
MRICLNKQGLDIFGPAMLDETGIVTDEKAARQTAAVRQFAWPRQRSGAPRNLDGGGEMGSPLGQADGGFRPAPGR